MTPNPERPNEELVKAWLEGDLSNEEAQRVEVWFEAHPEEYVTEVIPPDLLKGLDQGLDGRTLDPELTDLLNTQTPESAREKSSQSWRDFLGESAREDSLGTLGEYDVLEVIAEGGMGILFKAYDAKLDRYVAIKLLAPEFAINSTSRRRFLREAQASAKLEHESILPIYGVYDEAVPWFAMRFIEGGSLQDLLDAKEEIPGLQMMGLQLASALEMAHKAGIVHRDIKPANILVDGDRVWLCDFGIAQITQDPSLTMSGVLAGTPHYMSPEQAEGVLLDGRSDLFSLGAVLYHCATGEPPFTGDTTSAVLKNVALAVYTKPSQLNPELPPWFARLLENLLAKDPEDRFRNVTEVIQALETERAPRPKQRSRCKLYLLISSLSILLLAGLLQISPVKREASEVLATVLKRPFLIEGRLFPIADLKKAIEAARNDETIFLPGGETIYLDNISIPAGKRLTLEPRDTLRRPLLTVKEKGSSGIQAYSPLYLIDLDFQLNTRPNGNALIIFHHNGRVHNCTFQGGWEWKSGMSKVHAQTLETRATGTLEISQCQFNLKKTSSVTIRRFSTASDPFKVSFHECRIHSPFALNILHFASTTAPLQIAFENCQFDGVSAFRTSKKAAEAHIQVNALDTQFRNFGPLAWFRTPKYQTALKRFRWQDESCTYTEKKDNVYFGHKARVTKNSLVKPISDFKK